MFGVSTGPKQQLFAECATIGESLGHSARWDIAPCPRKGRANKPKAGNTLAIKTARLMPHCVCVGAPGGAAGRFCFR